MSNESTKQDTSALALAACSLPVAIVAASALSLRVLARSAVDARDARNALRLAGVLSGEADAACANKRQPEENDKISNTGTNA